MQIGCIWQHGGANPCRNLLDFNDITLDKQGRPLFVFADGCLPSKGCEPGAMPDTSRGAVDTIGRLDSCMTLFSEFDKTVGAAKCAKPATPFKPAQKIERQKVIVATSEKQGHGLLLGAFAPLMLLGMLLLSATRLRPFAIRKRLLRKITDTLLVSLVFVAWLFEA